MYTYPLRALSKDRRTIEVFSISDGPCFIDDEYFILIERPGSPILRIDSILRGMDIDGLFEGDILEQGGDRYVVSYLRGFAALREDREVFMLEDLDGWEVVSNVYEEPGVFIQRLLRHTYRSNDRMFLLGNIIGCLDDKLIVNINGGHLLPFQEIQQCANMTYKGTTLYFGDKVEGQPLKLVNGRCSIEIDGKIYDVSKGEII